MSSFVCVSSLWLTFVAFVHVCLTSALAYCVFFDCYNVFSVNCVSSCV